MAGADDNLLVIAGLGSSNWDITAAGDRPLNMPLWGSMGAPVGMGLGLALAQPTKRVLVITGERDAKFADFGRRLVASVSGTATHVVIEDADHAPHLQHPAEVTAAVRAFLADQDAE